MVNDALNPEYIYIFPYMHEREYVFGLLAFNSIYETEYATKIAT